MIKSKKDLRYYMECDKIALRISEKQKRPRILIDKIWKYEILLRKYEYYLNTSKSSIVKKILKNIYKLRFILLGDKLTIKLEPNVFGAGLSIAHYGSIIVNPNCKVGKNCRIQSGVVIGATNGNKKCPTIGDNCYIGTGAKIVGDIELKDSIAIGANAVVTKSFDASNVTLGGIPAKIISNNDSSMHLVKATEIVDARKCGKNE